MQIAHVILAHKELDQLTRLVNALHAPGHHFFIHLDARGSFSAEDLLPFEEAGHITLVQPRVKCRWGHFSLVEATLSCLRSLMASGKTFQHVNLISGQDYPLRTPGEMERFLSDRPDQQFINFFPLREHNQWTEHGGAFQSLRRIENLHVSFRSRWLHLPIKRRIPNDWVPHGGSQWWTLTGACVKWVMDKLAQQPEITRFFRHTFIPDELFFQTLVMNSPFASQAVNDNLRYVDFTRANPTPPAVLLDDDFAVLREGNLLFARKMDAQRSWGLLERIDRELLLLPSLEPSLELDLESGASPKGHAVHRAERRRERETQVPR